MKKNYSKRWQTFEKCFCEFLERFIEELGFTFILKPMQQESGSQFGYDISAKWHDSKFQYDWWFECKSHVKKSGATTINKREYADKILEVLANQHPPACYCLVAADRNFCNWFRRNQESINTNIKRTRVFEWTKRNHLEDCLMFYPDLYKKIYGKEPDTKGKDKKRIFQETKRQIIENNKKSPVKAANAKITTPEINIKTGSMEANEVVLNKTDTIEPDKMLDKQLSRVKK